jgi:hypothetical protein
MTLDVSRLATDKPNSAILDAVRGIASTDYARRIPAADVAGVAATIENLTKPENRQWMNEFIDVLVNRIGMTIARSTSWTNPLAPFKRGMLSYGNTIEEIQTGLLEAHGYDPDRDYMEQTLFGRERPEVQVNFHTVNRQDFYKVTINDVLLKRAFLDPNGLSGFINQLMEAPTTSDQWDEFLLTSSLFREYESNGGFFHVHVPDVGNLSSDESDAKMALRKMRAMAGNLRFLSTQYNAAKMPVFAQPEDLLLFVTPEFNAGIDVEALAGAFNIDRAQMYGKIVELPQSAFGIDGAQAIMTTNEFFVIADTLFESTNQWNPANLHNNYFLHHHQVISASRFVPAVMFTTGADDEVITVNGTVTGVEAITIEAVDGTVPTDVATGGIIQLVAKATTDPEDGVTAVMWSLTGSENPRTFITNSGVLHVAPDEFSTSVTVKATSAAVDFDNPRADPLSATLAVAVTGGPVGGWPAQGAGLVALTINDLPVPGIDPATFVYAFTVAPDTMVLADDVHATTQGSANVDVTVTPVGDPVTGYTVVVAVDNGVGAPVDYTVNVTFA